MVHSLDYSRKRARAVPLAIIVFGIALGVYALWSLMEARAPNVQGPRIPKGYIFYGLVMDQDGEPLRGVEIKVLISELDRNTIMPGGNVSVLATQKAFSVHTGENGVFGVSVLEDYQELQIVDVVKPGYEWVKDWAWSSPAYNERSNTYYFFEGKQSVMPYTPDPERPAIFPMHEIGNLAPATRPTRGGTDGDRKNEPVDLIIPSAGPGAPRTPEEINIRIHEHFEALNEAARSGRAPATSRRGGTD